MAQKLQVLLTCDLHDEAVDAVETVTFGYGGETFAFELCAEHLRSFRSVMEGYVAAARRTDARAGSARAELPARSPFATTAAATPSRPTDTGAIRVWARSAGYSISERGRISAEVRAAYEAAHRE